MAIGPGAVVHGTGEAVGSQSSVLMARKPDRKASSSADRAGSAEPPLPFVLGQLLEDVLHGLGTAARQRVHAAGFEDVRSAHDCVFRFLEPEGVRLRDLADRAGMTPQSVGEHVDELERLGYVQRLPDPSDRRAKLIRPTARGAAIIAAALDGLRDIEVEWNEALGPRRLAQMRRALETIRDLQALER
jgi:DNA-binding MarR family transcriptional regulator